MERNGWYPQHTEFDQFRLEIFHDPCSNAPFRLTMTYLDHLLLVGPEEK